MHIALLLRYNRKGLSCSAPSPTGRSTAELEKRKRFPRAEFSGIFLSGPSKKQNLSEFQNR
jgi:hypothetical protein